MEGKNKKRTRLVDVIFRGDDSREHREIRESARYGENGDADITWDLL